MERTYESAAALVGRAAGPLAGHLGAFVSSLIDQQYTASVIYIKAQHALAFDRWLAKRGVVLADLAICTSSVTSTAVGVDASVFSPRPGVGSATTSHNYCSSCAIMVYVRRLVSRS